MRCLHLIFSGSYGGHTQMWKNLKNLTLKYNLMSRKNCISRHAMSPFEAGTQWEIMKFHMYMWHFHSLSTINKLSGNSFEISHHLSKTGLFQVYLLRWTSWHLKLPSSSSEIVTALHDGASWAQNGCVVCLSSSETTTLVRISNTRLMHLRASARTSLRQGRLN